MLTTTIRKRISGKTEVKLKSCDDVTHNCQTFKKMIDGQNTVKQ